MLVFLLLSQVLQLEGTYMVQYTDSLFLSRVSEKVSYNKPFKAPLSRVYRFTTIDNQTLSIYLPENDTINFNANNFILSKRHALNSEILETFTKNEFFNTCYYLMEETDAEKAKEKINSFNSPLYRILDTLKNIYKTYYSDEDFLVLESQIKFWPILAYEQIYDSLELLLKQLVDSITAPLFQQNYPLQSNHYFAYGLNYVYNHIISSIQNENSILSGLRFKKIVDSLNIQPEILYYRYLNNEIEFNFKNNTKYHDSLLMLINLIETNEYKVNLINKVKEKLLKLDSTSKGSFFENNYICDSSQISVLNHAFENKHIYAMIGTSYCAPCIKNNQFILDNYQKINAFPIDIIYISKEGEEKFLNFIRKKRYPWRCFYNPDKSLDKLPYNFVPLYVVLNNKGEVIEWNASPPQEFFKIIFDEK